MNGAQDRALIVAAMTVVLSVLLACVVCGTIVAVGNLIL